MNRTKKLHAYTETASNWALWQEYVDPNTTMTEEEFDAMSIEKKIGLMVECFGEPDPDSEN